MDVAKGAPCVEIFELLVNAYQELSSREETLNNCQDQMTGTLTRTVGLCMKGPQ